MTREEKIAKIVEHMFSSDEENIMLAAEYDPETKTLTGYGIIIDDQGTEESTFLFTLEGDDSSTPESLKTEFEGIMEAAILMAKQLATAPLN